MATTNNQASTTEQQPFDQENSPLAASTRKPWPWILLVALIVSGGIVFWRFSASTGGTAPAKAAAQAPRPVVTTPLTVGSGVRQVELIGQAESTQQATVRAQTDGVIRQVLVQPGDRLRPGSPIAILDDADQQLAVAQALAELAQERSNLARLEVGTRKEVLAQRQAELRSTQAREQEALDNLRRTTDLVRQGALSERLLVEAKAAVDDAKGARLAAEATLAEAVAGPIREEIEAQRARVAAAQAAVNQARLALQRTQITAVNQGVVQTRQISPGDYVESADPVLTMVAGSQLDIFLELPENLSGQIQPGMPIGLTARALPNWQAQATVTGVVPSADAASRRQRVRLRLENPPSGLLPGMAIAGRLTLPSNRPSFLISRDALTRRQDQWLVFTIVDNKAQQQPVELAADMGEQVAIASDQLRAGQPIVLQGGDGLQNGAAVKLVQPEAQPSVNP
ncbi:MAG: efflux RND transporter periplasmic adaptor subunit [Aphanocapsa sp. GSE-SYN-MK-11-07L]|jgi:RND family efflux transporter MFP subunit|nr:efflux RND transporter periplasmic adaptor subunit [Aphanocapsa sp. GSE-SYN-MK-11-07L]